MDELTSASDPISCRQQFWDALALADESLAVEAATRVRPPPVELQRFDFEDIDDDGVDARVGQGTLVMPVEPGSSGMVLNTWNSVSRTTLMLLESIILSIHSNECTGS